jgi:UDP-N-acetylglucosamine 1-carboxyvinyltransferase
MGAKIEILNAHKAKIFGPTPLSGADIVSLDIRAGATVILAGLVAQGETSITNAEIIDRGYEKIEERLQKIGAKIQRVE